VTDRLLTAREVAELLAVPVGWVREHTRTGAIPHVRLGRYVRYDEGDVRAWVESVKAGGGPAFRRHRPEVRA
jgi:excisionase family DNA binding protein